MHSEGNPRQIGSMLERFDWRALPEGDGAAAEGRGLVAALLRGFGVPGAEVVAAALWARFGSLGDLLAAPADAIEACAGADAAEALRLAQAIRVAASDEAARGALRERPEGNAEAMAALLAPRIAFAPVEVMVAALFDARGGLIGVEEVMRGSSRGVAVDRRAIVQAALNRGAGSVCVAHNHPSGDPTPSGADRRWTRGMNATLRDLDVGLRDHLVLARGRWVSMRREMPEIF